MASSGAAQTYEQGSRWWREAVVYQIYPSSFYDSNGDGIGDIPGIIEKLPYLQALGVDCIWLSPHYASPQIDMGYDISDYEDIYPPYGTLEQTQQLIDECHRRGMKIIFDLVINHTSSEHAWFKESRSSKTNPKRDWFFWKPPRGWQNGKPLPPNNWRSTFGGSAWEFDEHTQEFYLHLFAIEQPDLNWENPDARKAIYETSMHFWLRRGIDGFRVDVVGKLSKVIAFPDAEIVDVDSYEQNPGQYVNHGPRIHEFLSEMHEVLSQYQTYDGGEIMTVGELVAAPTDQLVRDYVSAAKKQLNMVFNFEAVALGQIYGDKLKAHPYSVKDFARAMSMWQLFVNGTDAWTTVFLENHDQPRSISRFGDDATEEMRTRSGKLLAIILATMTGTLFLYQGQEIGMTNVPPSWDLDEYKDIWSTTLVKMLREDKDCSSEMLEEARKGLQAIARDNARTPMQWNDSPNGGFCGHDVRPWMRVNDNFPTVNVKSGEDNAGSLLSFWKRLIHLRKERKDEWVYGTFELLETPSNIFAFRKESGAGRKTVTVANMSGESVRWSYRSKFLLSNVREEGGFDVDWLDPWEARLYVE